MTQRISHVVFTLTAAFLLTAMPLRVSAQSKNVVPMDKALCDSLAYLLGTKIAQDMEESGFTNLDHSLILKGMQDYEKNRRSGGNAEYGKEFKIQPWERLGVIRRYCEAKRGKEYPKGVTSGKRGSVTSPLFMGGDINNLSNWVNSRLKYPAYSIRNREEGTVLLSFVVTEEGDVDEIKVISGVSPALDAEAVLKLSQSPKWTPGYIDGKPVRVHYTFPVIFRLK